jgi:hypothetical protein
MNFQGGCKARQIPSKMMPVPRKLSSSCGTCVKFEAQSPEFIGGISDREDFEALYLADGDEYRKLNMPQLF